MSPQSAPPARRLTDDDIERLIDRAAAKAADDAVSRAFKSLGIDPADPEHVSSWHADRLWTRSAREGSGRLQLAVKTSIVGTLTTALLYGIWRLIQSGSPPAGS